MIHIELNRRFILIAVLILVTTSISVFFLSSRLLPTPQRSFVKPTLSRDPERIMIYGGVLVGRTDTLVRVQLNQNKIVAGFVIDDSTQVFKILKSDGFTMKKMNSNDIPLGTSLSVSVVPDLKSKTLVVRQIIFE